ncbi:MAG TPA: hypothetical protein VGB19_03905, partial [Actinomycetota bacterium]
MRIASSAFRRITFGLHGMSRGSPTDRTNTDRSGFPGGGPGDSLGPGAGDVDGEAEGPAVGEADSEGAGVVGGVVV